MAHYRETVMKEGKSDSSESMGDICSLPAESITKITTTLSESISELGEERQGLSQPRIPKTQQVVSMKLLLASSNHKSSHHSFERHAELLGSSAASLHKEAAAVSIKKKIDFSAEEEKTSGLMESVKEEREGDLESQKKEAKEGEEAVEMILQEEANNDD